MSLQCTFLTILLPQSLCASSPHRFTWSWFYMDPGPSCIAITIANTITAFPIIIITLHPLLLLLVVVVTFSSRLPLSLYESFPSYALNVLFILYTWHLSELILLSLSFFLFSPSLNSYRLKICDFWLHKTNWNELNVISKTLTNRRKHGERKDKTSTFLTLVKGNQLLYV